MFERLVCVVPLLPWFAAAWIGIGLLSGANRGEQGERATVRIAMLSTLLSLVLLLLLLGEKWLLGLPLSLVFGSWFETTGITIKLSFSLDNLSLILAALVTLLSALTLKFSANYLHREKGFQRFYVVMALFTGAMQLIFLAGNGVFTFAAWELAGICSYLLIGYSYERGSVTKSAMRALITNRIGGAAFLVANILAIIWLKDPDWSVINAGPNTLNTLESAMLLLGFLLAAMVKSAQIPFTPWIGKALEGPTPSSAIFYGSVMVHAGVYLLLRLQPLIEQVPVLEVFIGVVGLITALYGWFVALVKSDVKSALIMSVVSQVGLMFLWIGLGWYTFAAWHLVLHACVRAYQFLLAPAFVQKVNKPPHAPPRWLASKPWLYTAAIRQLWLDEIEDWLVTHPTQQLAKEMRRLDEDVVTRLAGMPAQSRAVQSLHQVQQLQQGEPLGQASTAVGSGVFGRVVEHLAIATQWLENRLVMTEGGERFFSLLEKVGQLLYRVEHFLAQPRYLLVLVAVTFVVIL